MLSATWINGTAIRYLDYNDTLMSRDPSHPSGNFAAVLAVAEAQGLGGRDLIAGLVYAYELQLRLVDHSGEPCLWTRGWDHPTNMVYGSAGAAAKLLGLPPGEDRPQPRDRRQPGEFPQRDPSGRDRKNQGHRRGQGRR